MTDNNNNHPVTPGKATGHSPQSTTLAHSNSQGPSTTASPTSNVSNPPTQNPSGSSSSTASSPSLDVLDIDPTQPFIPDGLILHPSLRPDVLSRATFSAKSLSTHYRPKWVTYSEFPGVRNKAWIYKYTHSFPYSGYSDDDVVTTIRLRRLSPPQFVNNPTKSRTKITISPEYYSRGSSPESSSDSTSVVSQGEFKEFYVNFSDSRLAGNYHTALLASDEHFSMEQPILGSLRDSLQEMGDKKVNQPGK